MLCFVLCELPLTRRKVYGTRLGYDVLGYDMYGQSLPWAAVYRSRLRRSMETSTMTWYITPPPQRDEFGSAIINKQ